MSIINVAFCVFSLHTHTNTHTHLVLLDRKCVCVLVRGSRAVQTSPYLQETVAQSLHCQHCNQPRSFAPAPEYKLGKLWGRFTAGVGGRHTTAKLIPALFNTTFPYKSNKTGVTVVSVLVYLRLRMVFVLLSVFWPVFTLTDTHPLSLSSFQGSPHWE